MRKYVGRGVYEKEKVLYALRWMRWERGTARGAGNCGPRKYPYMLDPLPVTRERKILDILSCRVYFGAG